MAQTERRKGNEEILVAIAEIKKDTHQIFNRLDKINGCVQDYVENRHKWQDTIDDIYLLNKKLNVCTDQPKVCEDKYIGRKLFIFVASLLGLVMTSLTLLNFFTS